MYGYRIKVLLAEATPSMLALYVMVMAPVAVVSVVGQVAPPPARSKQMEATYLLLAPVELDWPFQVFSVLSSELTEEIPSELRIFCAPSAMARPSVTRVRIV